MRKRSATNDRSFKTRRLRDLALSAAASALALLLAVPATGRATDRTEAGQRALRVLFIGNSYTRFNDLPRMVRELGETVPGAPRLHTTRETHGGYDLRRHWRQRRVRQRIATGHYDAVVIQSHSLAPIMDRDRLTEYARRFSERAQSAGARLVLFQTWARHPRSRAYRRYPIRDHREMFERIEHVYRELGAELGASVSPVGRAWQEALEALPTTELHRADGTHPALAGTYLSACVLFGTLTNIDPRTASYVPYPMDALEAAKIRAVVAQSLLED